MTLRYSFPQHGGQQRPSSSMGAPFAGPRPPLTRGPKPPPNSITRPIFECKPPPPNSITHSNTESSLPNHLFPRYGGNKHNAQNLHSNYSMFNGNSNHNKNTSNLHSGNFNSNNRTDPSGFNNYNKCNNNHNVSTHHHNNKISLKKSLSTPVSKAQSLEFQAMTNPVQFYHNPTNDNFESQSKTRFDQFETQSNADKSLSSLVGGDRGSGIFSPRLPPPPPPLSAANNDSLAKSSSTYANYCNQIEELARLLTRYFDAVKLCYATNISVAQSFAALLAGDDAASIHAAGNEATGATAARFFAISRENGGRIIEDAQRHKDAAATQLVALVAQLTEGGIDSEDAAMRDVVDRILEERPVTDLRREVLEMWKTTTDPPETE